MNYVAKAWADGVAGNTPIFAADLDHLEQGVAAALPTADLDAESTAVDANPASALRVQQDARLSTTFAGIDRGKFPFTRNVDFLGLPKWAAALARQRNGSGDAKILVCGDSTVAGVGSSSSTVHNLNSWPSRLITLLNQAGYAAAPGLTIPPKTSDTRWVLGAGWATQPYYGFSGKTSFKGTHPTGALVFGDSRASYDRFDIYYLQFGSSGNFTATATGGATSTVVAHVNPAAIQKITVSAAAAATTNTVSIASSLGDLIIVGIEPWLSTASRIRVGNAGASGTRASEWAVVDQFGSAVAIAKYAPDLTIFSLGINDAGSALSAATYLANMQTLITAARLSGDVIVLTMPPSSDATQSALEAAYVRGLYDLGVPIIDVFNRAGGQWATMNALGMMSDTLHPNDLGYWDMAGFAAAALKTVG